MNSTLAGRKEVTGIGIGIKTLRAMLEDRLESQGITVEKGVLDFFQSQWEAADTVCNAYGIQPDFWSHGACFPGFDIEIFSDSRGVQVDVPIHSNDSNDLEKDQVFAACDFPNLNIYLSELVHLKYDGTPSELVPESAGFRTIEPKFDVKDGKLCVPIGSRKHAVTVGGNLMWIS